MSSKASLATKQPAEPMKASIDRLQAIMGAVVLVLFVGFAGVFVATGAMMVDALTNKNATYVELSNQVKNQNDKIEELTEELRKSNEQKTIQKTN